MIGLAIWAAVLQSDQDDVNAASSAQIDELEQANEALEQENGTRAIRPPAAGGRLRAAGRRPPAAAPGGAGRRPRPRPHRPRASSRRPARSTRRSRTSSVPQTRASPRARPSSTASPTRPRPPSTTPTAPPLRPRSGSRPSGQGPTSPRRASPPSLTCSAASTPPTTQPRVSPRRLGSWSRSPPTATPATEPPAGSARRKANEAGRCDPRVGACGRERSRPCALGRRPRALDRLQPEPLPAAGRLHLLPGALSLFPLAIFLVSIFGIFIHNAERREDVVTWVVDQLLLSADGSATLDQAVEGLDNPSSALGLVAVLGVLWGASGMMAAIRIALTNVWGLPRYRAVRGKVLDLVLVLLAGGLLLVAFAVTLVVRLVEDVGEQVGSAVGGWSSWVGCRGRAAVARLAGPPLRGDPAPLPLRAQPGAFVRARLGAGLCSLLSRSR